MRDRSGGGFRKWMLANPTYASDEFPANDGGWSSEPFVSMEPLDEVEARRKNWKDDLIRRGSLEHIRTVEELELETKAMGEGLRKLRMNEARELVEEDEETIIVRAFDAPHPLASNPRFPRNPIRPTRLLKEYGEEKEADKHYPFVRRLTEDELSIDAITGKLLENAPSCQYHSISPNGVDIGVHVHLPAYMERFVKLQHAPIIKKGTFATVNMIISDRVMDMMLLDSGASNNVMPASVCTELKLNNLTPIRSFMVLADGSVSKMAPRIADGVRVRISNFIYILDFVVYDIPLDDSSCNLNPIILGTPFLAAAEAVLDFGRKRVRLFYKDDGIELAIGPLSGNTWFSQIMTDASGTLTHRYLRKTTEKEKARK